jgi:hypothetical protein
MSATSTTFDRRRSVLAGRVRAAAGVAIAFVIAAAVAFAMLAQPAIGDPAAATNAQAAGVRADLYVHVLRENRAAALAPVAPSMVDYLRDHTIRENSR